MKIKKYLKVSVSAKASEICGICEYLGIGIRVNFGIGAAIPTMRIINHSRLQTRPRSNEKHIAVA